MDIRQFHSEKSFIDLNCSKKASQEKEGDDEQD